MEQLYKGPAPAENADIDRLVHDGVLAPIAGKVALPAKAGKNDDVREYLLTMMSAQDADDLISHRKAKKMPLTRRAAEGLVKHFAAARKMFGWSVTTCIDHMTSQGWRGFDENWVAASKAQAQAAAAKAKQAEHGGKYMRGRASDAAARLIQREADNGDRSAETECHRPYPQRLPSDRGY
ncbi:hypothetical protein [Candidatus Tokpelaia sp.]|uniref:hypothetical protein n=1 Tax=Candidatus Tokpelaia sp. TaxID=2233777 RepID=UPI0012395E74|nr:hypothetical protein [Candidatus Tokpelaia sp.]KAA6405771.1 hypothetical protein DPQ22_02800 [Candidatus Tokpelaia sp.]